MTRQTPNRSTAAAILPATLDPTGPEGFEGLIGALLGVLTKRRFRLSASGSQAGRDLTSGESGGTVIAVESKLYADQTDLSERDLLGELAQAQQDEPDLDLWVLVASRSIKQQLHQALTDEAKKRGMEFRSISAADGDPSSLDVLLATDSAVVARFLVSAGKASASEIERVAGALNLVQNAPGFEIQRSALRETFSDASIGYDHWVARQAEELRRSFSVPARSKVVFEGQVITVCAPSTVLVERQAVTAALDDWSSRWSAQRPGERPAKVMLGEEGDGKTWGVAAWIARAPMLRRAVFINAQAAGSQNPTELLANAVSSLVGEANPETWRKRFTRWAEHRSPDEPSVLLVLDGINERHEPSWWRGLLDRLQDEPWSRTVATIITCRASYWRQHFADLSHLRRSETEVGPFSEPEVAVALSNHGLTRSDFREELMPLLRKPRYLAMAVKYRARVMEAGDFTVARLLYEDAKDRYERRRGALDDQSFQSVLVELARKTRSGEPMTSADVARLLPPHVRPHESLTELITGGILEGHGSRATIAATRLPLALGLLLAEDVREAAANGTRTLGDVVQAWLEPEAGIPLKADICEHATLHALNSEAFGDDECVALLDAWAQLQNAPGRDEGFPSYFPCRPSAYFGLAELRWADVEYRVSTHRQLMDAFLRWRGNPYVQRAMVERFERWLGFVHPAGFRALYGAEPADLDKSVAEIAARVGSPLHAGPGSAAGYALTVVDDPGLLRLGRTALAVISHVPREPFARALAIGVVAEEIMGRPEKYDVFRWVCRSGPGPLADALRPHVDSLLSQAANPVALRAAYRLLTYLGTPEALDLRRTLPSDLFQPSPWLKEDPCSGLPWARDNCAPCSARSDIKVSVAARAVAPHATDPDLRVDDGFVERLDGLAQSLPGPDRWTHVWRTIEDSLIDEVEPTLCAFRPASFARAIQQMAREAPARDGQPLRSLLWGLRGHELVLSPVEWAALRAAWERLIAIAEGSEGSSEYTEESLFGMLLLDLSPDDQLRLLLKRPAAAGDMVAYETLLGCVVDWDHARGLLRTRRDPVTLRRALWFLACNAESIPPDVVQLVAPLCRHDDSLVRASALKIILEVGTEDHVRDLEGTGWTAGTADQNYIENHWGSWLLIDRARWLSLDAIRRRIPESYYADAVEHRGAGAADFIAYAQWLDGALAPYGSLPVTVELRRDEHRDRRDVFRPGSQPAEEPTRVLRSRASTWGDAAAATAEQYKDAFDWDERQREFAERLDAAQKEAAKERRGNLGLIDSPSRSVLESVVSAAPDLAERWLAVAYSDKVEDRRRVAHQPAFFQDFCAVLLKASSTKGVGLYKRLKAVSVHDVVDSSTRISSLDLALWAAPPGADIDSLRGEVVANAISDAELSRIAFAAEYGHNLPSLGAIIDAGWRSPRLLDQARALTLEHLGAENPRPMFAPSLSDDDQTFLAEVARAASRWSDSNRNAKHWYGRVLSAHSDLEAWAAFRLLLRCVDKRFWLWNSQIERESDAQCPPKRLRFLRAHRHLVERAAKERDRVLERSLVGSGILDSGTWPWMTTVESVEQNPHEGRERAPTRAPA